jgi:hypothetical protein
MHAPHPLNRAHRAAHKRSASRWHLVHIGAEKPYSEPPHQPLARHPKQPESTAQRDAADAECKGKQDEVVQQAAAAAVRERGRRLRTVGAVAGVRCDGGDELACVDCGEWRASAGCQEQALFEFGALTGQRHRCYRRDARGQCRKKAQAPLPAIQQTKQTADGRLA